MTVRDILKVTPVYIDVKIYHENKKFVLCGKSSDLLATADFVMARRVKQIEVDGHGPLSRWIAITLDAEKENER